MNSIYDYFNLSLSAWTSSGPFGSFYPMVASNPTLQGVPNPAQLQNFLSQQSPPNFSQISPQFKF